MLALHKPVQEKTCSVNILPCRINQTGPTKVSKRYWSPKNETDGTQTAHFRGRKLQGRRIKLAEGYEGIVAKQTEKLVPLSTAPVRAQSFANDFTEVEEDGDQPEPVKILEVAATFDEIVVWGHEALPAADDTFVKGVEEWIAFAEAIHREPAENK